MRSCVLPLLLCALAAAEEPPATASPAAAPGPEWVWEGGHWEAAEERHRWVPGRFVQMPPKPEAPPAPPVGMVWRPGQWGWSDGGWRWRAGHYEPAPADAPAAPVIAAAPAPPPAPTAQVVVVRSDPPPVRVEVMPPRPAPDAVWIAGSWTWRSRSWAWIGGCWSRPPHRGAVWVQPRWHRGHGGGWRCRSGYWR